MRNLREKRGYSLDKILLTIGFTGLIVCFLWGILGMYFRMVAYQHNVVGALYLENPEVAKEYLYTLFEPVSDEKMAAGEKALSEFGITTDGKGDIGSTLRIGRIAWTALFMAFIMIAVICYGWHRVIQKERLEKQRLEERIRELEKTQSKEEYLREQNQKIQNFIENVAHQIKTPLSRVFSSLYIIEENLEHREQKARIEECYSHLESVSGLMKRLIDIGRLEAGKVIFQKEEFDLRMLVDEVVRNCVGETGKVQTNFASEENMLYHGDYEWLGEALKNIVKNGLEHDKSGIPLEIICVRDEEQIRITVRDHGPGLNQKDIPNLFDRFYIPEEVKANHTGIGLNLAKLIVEGHFGMIYVQNHAEGGAVFNIILPLYSLKMGKHTV